MDNQYFVYIVTNKINGVLYTGVTSNLKKRIWEHKNKTIKGFSSRYNTDRLVYYEIFNNADEAIHREKCIKHWYRGWKIEAIESSNPEWNDLYSDI